MPGCFEDRESQIAFSICTPRTTISRKRTEEVAQNRSRHGSQRARTNSRQFVNFNEDAQITPVSLHRSNLIAQQERVVFCEDKKLIWTIWTALSCSSRTMSAAAAVSQYGAPCRVPIICVINRKMGSNDCCKVLYRCLLLFSEEHKKFVFHCGSVDRRISPRRCSSTAGREGRARLKRAFSPEGGSGRANKTSYRLEVQSQEDSNVRT